MKACENIIQGINFFGNQIRVCNTIFLGPAIINEKDLKQISFQKLIEARQKLLDNCKNNIIDERCKKCPHLKDEDWNFESKINTIHVFHWIHCNCGCLYCANNYYSKGEFSDEIKDAENYNLYPIIKELYEKDLIDKTNLTVHFGGGEPVVLKEMPQLIDIFLENNVKEMRLMSSCITYSPVISKAMKKGHPLVFALSCGTKDIFAKIKRRDLFEQTVNNIKRYQEEAGIYRDRTVSRYIIFDRFNNTKEEIKNWLNLSKELQVGFVDLSLDFCGSLERKKGQKIEKNIYELFDFAKSEALKIGMKLSIEQFSAQMLEKGEY